MDSHQERIKKLHERIDALMKQQEFFAKEILELKKEVFHLTYESEETVTPPTPEVKPESISEKEKISEPVEPPPAQPIPKAPEPFRPKPVKKVKSKSDLEKFIGENLINKIGIVITVIGVAIGAKYSIENDLISPLTRIILGYLAGFALLAIGVRLKKNYENYSAVLVSGAMAIMYFITFSAYTFYELIPQWLAFVLMFVFTAFTVIASLNYNKQVIAHIGLVGAYAVPFLIGEDPGNAMILFSYMAIINVGIMVIAFRKYWKTLYYVAFLLTWLIYVSWFAFDYNDAQHFVLALAFQSIFFVIFYLTFLAYKLNKKIELDVFDVFFIILNSFVYYGLGYIVLDGNQVGSELLGLFTLANAIVHFIVTVILYKRKKANVSLFYIIAGLVLVFITMAVPVQLDGNWVTLIWAFEAALLFWLGRTKGLGTYEWFSYILMVLAFFSLLQDWVSAYDSYPYIHSGKELTPILNIHFLTSVLVVLALGFVTWLNHQDKYVPGLAKNNPMRVVFSVFIPAMLLVSLYGAFRLEIMTYFNQLYGASSIDLSENQNIYMSSTMDGDIRDFKVMWVLNYTLLFLSALTWINLKKIKNVVLGYIGLGLNLLAILVFLVQGLYVLSELRESYLDQTMAEYYHRGIFHMTIRYISLLFLLLIMSVSYQFVLKYIKNKILRRLFNLLLHFITLWVLSSELLHWLDVAENNDAYKLGLSILWGIYSLMLIIVGIWKNRQHLRIGAIVLFGATLIKLFFYDIAHLNTLSKTIVFVSLGGLLLLISFLYNKYKNKILNEPED